MKAKVWPYKPYKTRNYDKNRFRLQLQHYPFPCRSWLLLPSAHGKGCGRQNPGKCQEPSHRSVRTRHSGRGPPISGQARPGVLHQAGAEQGLRQRGGCGFAGVHVRQRGETEQGPENAAGYSAATEGGEVLLHVERRNRVQLRELHDNLGLWKSS